MPWELRFFFAVVALATFVLYVPKHRPSRKQLREAFERGGRRKIMYDHRNPTRFSREECEEAVGRCAVLVLTGEVVEAREGPAGPFVIFRADERFGFDDFRVGMDALQFSFTGVADDAQ